MTGKTTKAILISEGGAEELRVLLAGLGLPKRALSLSVDPEAGGAVSAIPSFIELWGEVEAIRATLSGWPFSARVWLVAEFVPMAYQRGWPSGTPSPGVRMVSTIHRRKGMTREAFAAHWCGPHAEIARSYTVPVWHYNQNVVVEAFDPESTEDGFVGMHFQTVEALRARWQDYPDEAARGAEDAALFMDVERSLSMTAVETVWENDA